MPVGNKQKWFDIVTGSSNNPFMRIPLIDLPGYHNVYLTDMLDNMGKYHTGVMLSARHTKIRKYHLMVLMEDGTRFLVGHGRNPLNMHMEPLTCGVRELGPRLENGELLSK